jgi:hypothetical protein
LGPAELLYVLPINLWGSSLLSSKV